MPKAPLLPRKRATKFPAWTTHSRTVGDELEVPDTRSLTTKNATKIPTSPPPDAINPCAPPMSFMEDVIEESKLPPLPIRSSKAFALMALPIELRSKILGNLLPNVLEVRDRGEEQGHLYLRPGHEPRYTDVLLANRQLYDEGATVLYNRIFQVSVNDDRFRFLGLNSFRIPIFRPDLGVVEWVMNHSRLPRPWGLETVSLFPFHRVKQIRIELWATDFQDRLFDLRTVLMNFCYSLYGQPSLRNVRLDLYDRSYQPFICLDTDAIPVDDDEAHPAQDNNNGDIYILEEDKDCIWGPWFQAYTKNGFVLWERRSGVLARSHHLCASITDLELILQTLKLLRNVGRARINLTPGAEKNGHMRRIARECQEAMMSSGPREDLEVDFMEWCSDPSLPWNLDSLFSDEPS